MPRPIKPRRISFIPKKNYFIPIGVKKSELEEINLKVEELEAMRLKDIEGLKQEECSERMKVSRQTFQLIIDSARKKVARALTEGKAISIEGGNYTLNICKYKCTNCGIVFSQTYEEKKDNCPKCNSKNIMGIERNKFCNKVCRRKSICFKSNSSQGE